MLWLYIAPGFLISGSWDRTVKTWDARRPDGAPTSVITVPERVYCVTQTGPDTLIVATAGRRVLLYDLRRMGGGENPLLMLPRESSLKHQTRVVRGFPNGTGFATGSIEGRVAIDYVDPAPAAQAAKYSFKCHRVKTPEGERVFPVHAIAFHPGFGTFATGGCIGGRGEGVGIFVVLLRRGVQCVWMSLSYIQRLSRLFPFSAYCTFF